MTFSISGRTTLTTTSRPSASRAAWTWAMDADASGSRDELAEDLLDRAPERVAHDRGRRLAGERRHPILEAGELVGDVFGQQVAAGREDLAELDEDRAEILQRAAQPHRARRLRPATQFQGRR